jgi:ribosome-associated heat shock protein Hsp15
MARVSPQPAIPATNYYVFMTGIRIDKWLWAARFFKTRTLATEACESGRIACNSQPAKPSRNLKLGDLLHIRNEAGEYDIQVLELSDTRGSAAMAQTLYAETDASRERRARQAAEREAERKLNPQPAFPRGKPSKRDRRQIHSFRGEF